MNSISDSRHAIGSDSPLPDAGATLAEHCIATTFEDLPAAVISTTKNQIIDTIGIAIAGIQSPGVTELMEFTREMGGKPEARIWGTPAIVPAQDAARVNATMSHALDYDDTYERSFVHPAAFTVPTAFAIAEQLGNVTGKELITAIALGVDVSCRLANSARPGITGFVHGWHNTTLYGYFGAAAVAAKLLGLNRDQFISAFGIAYHQVSGNSQAHVDGALTKRMGPGFAAYGGILASRFAERGVLGATQTFEGIRGFFFQYHANDYSRELLFENLGEQFCSSDISFKPWPSCRGSHTAIDASLRLRKKYDFSVDEISKITIANASGDHALLATPLLKKQKPGTPVDAQFSNPWVVAAALVDGTVGLEHFTAEAVTRADLLGLTEKIVTMADDTLLRPGGGPGGARVTILLNDSREISESVSYALGEPSNPLSDTEIYEKFQNCMARSLVTPQASSQLLHLLRNIETLPDAAKTITSLPIVQE